MFQQQSNRTCRAKTLMNPNPLALIFEQKCQDNNLKVQQESLQSFLKSQREPEKLHLQNQNIISVRTIGNLLNDYIYLNLSNNPLKNSELVYLAKRINKSQLIHVDLSNNNLNLLEFLETLNSHTLISLNLSGIRLNIKEIEGFQLNNLQFLYLKNVQLNNKKFKILEGKLENSQLLYLDISQNSTQLKQLPKSQILHLNVSYNFLDDIHFQFLNLQQLNISNNPLNENSIKCLCFELNRSQLQKLILDNIILSEYFLLNLRCQLEYLSIQNCGVLKINELINNNNRLKCLLLNDNYEVEVPKLKIEKISLDRCFYNETQINEFFSQLYHNTRVKHISIKETYISQHSLTIIENALQVNRTLLTIETGCELSTNIKYLLKLNQTKSLEIAIQTSRNEKLQEQKQIYKIKNLIKTRYESEQKSLSNKNQHFEQFKKQQIKQSQQMELHLIELQNYDLELNKQIDDICREMIKFDIQSGADICFYQKNINEYKQAQRNMKYNLKVRQQEIDQYKKRILTLQNEEILWNLKLEQAKKLQKIYKE